MAFSLHFVFYLIFGIFLHSLRINVYETLNPNQRTDVGDGTVILCRVGADVPGGEMTIGTRSLASVRDVLYWHMDIIFLFIHP